MLFAQVREDPSIEHCVIDKLDTNLKILCVTSGGCTVLSLLTDKISHIDAIDINVSQNYLCELKASVCKYLKNISDILNFYQGVNDKNYYDKIINELDLTIDCKEYWLDNMDSVYFGINRSGKFEELFRYLVATNMDYKKAFDREYLIKIFGEDAVKNSKDKEFYDHFSGVVEIYKNMYSPEDNYFYYQILYDSYPINKLPYYLNNLDNLNNAHKIKYIVGNYVAFIRSVEDNSYDIVQTSNLTDWMNNSELVSFIKELHRIVKPNGYVIMRRLNGDYSIKNIINGYFISDNNIPVDKSHFYSEVVVGCKHV